MKKTVNFLTIRSVTIENFDLYPSGLHHDFQNGVNVAIGVNGIGKTTLLRAIYRAISGLADIRDNQELGEGQRRVFTLSNPISLFSPVAQDGAERASIEVVLTAGDAEIRVVRSLRTLKLISCTKNGLNVFSENLGVEEQYQMLLAEQIGVPSFFDVLLVLRYVMFALEDRRSIVWDSDAQVELLQIFLYPTEDQKSYRLAFNEAMKADSAARNYQSLLSKEEKKYRAQAAQLPSLETVNQLDEAILSLRPEVEKLEAEVERLDQERKNTRSLKLRLEEELLSHDLAEENLREQHLADLLPELDDYGAYIVSRLEQGACLVCGSTDVPALDSILKKLMYGHECPVCSSNIGDKDEIPVVGADVSLDELRASRIKAEDQRAALMRLEEETRVSFSIAYKKWVETEDELNRTLARQKTISGALGISPAELLGQHKLVRETLEQQRDQYRREKDVAVAKLRHIAVEHLEQIKEFCDEMSNSFNELISSLLAEKCILTWSISEKSIGQGASEISVPMPTFLIRMTSGVFTGTPAPRHHPTDVSESQRELIDLAFRLSIIKVFAKNKSASLLTETPDDGLDVAFIPNYAQVIRDAALRANPGSTFLVTANLNGGPLIRMLLLEDSSSNAQEDKSDYVIDLLHKSAMTAAVKKYGARYDDALREATGITLP